MNTLQATSVAKKLDVSKSTVWRYHRTDPTFPRAFTLGPGVTVWDEDEINKWLQAKKGETDET